MKINYDVERKDIFAFQLYAILKNKVVWFILAFTLLFQLYNSFAGPLQWVISANLVQTLGWDWVLRLFMQAGIEFGINMLVVSAMLLFFTVMAVTFLTSKYKSGDGTLGKHLMELNEAGLLEVTDVNETTHSWKSVGRIADWKNYILIYVSATNAHAIPKRSFASRRDAGLFLDEAVRLRDDAASSYSPSYLAVNG